MTPTPVVVVGGYLGAGKTTFINGILRVTDLRITVLVNDFGSINIDASLIRNSNGDTVELTNGCVCCAVGDDLAAALLTIVDSPVRPDLVLIETSGVADPRIASTYAHINGLRAGGIIVIVDGVQVEAQLQNPLIGSTVRRQFEAADLLLVSKCAGPVEAIVSELLRSVNPSAHVMVADDLDPRLIGSAKVKPVTGRPPAHDARHASRVENPVIGNQQDALDWLQSLEPHDVRAKGVVATDTGNLLMERIGTHCSVVVTTAPPTNGVVVISAGEPAGGT